MKTRQCGPIEKKNASVGEIIFLRSDCDENGYFQKRVSVVEALMWMKGTFWGQTFLHTPLPPLKKKIAARFWVDQDERTTSELFVLSFRFRRNISMAWTNTADLKIAVTLSEAFRRLTVTTLLRYTSKLVNWYWFTQSYICYTCDRSILMR